MTTFARNRIEMKAEREFAGFVLPYAAGVFLSTGIGLTGIIQCSIACQASFAATAAIFLLMIHPVRRRQSSMSVWLVLILLGLAVGTFCGFSSDMLGICHTESAISIRAAGFGRRLAEAVAGIPFENHETNAIIKALITGERNGIPESVTDAFRDSGAAHILALSGFHLGIIYAIVRYTLSLIGNSPDAVRIRSIIIIISCGFYTLATGAGPSIVRAFLFILLGETAGLAHRHRSTSSLLLSALMLQLLLSPSSIRSVSFQLSYAAMAGIAYIYPRLRDFWPGRKEDDRAFIRGTRWLWNSAALSISCQLTTAPLAWLYFESFPRHFLLTNLIALPLTGLIIPASLLTLALSTLGLCPEPLIKATEELVTALTAALEIIAGM